MFHVLYIKCRRAYKGDLVMFHYSVGTNLYGIIHSSE